LKQKRRRKVNTDIPQLDWQNWVQRYDVQQSTYLPDRERRFTAMLDVLETLLPERFVALDLACGPGSISQRLLSRFPQARSIAVDIDPVLLLLGQQTLGNMQGRLRWVDVDLSDPSWHTQLGEEHVDAVVSTTALHWLPVGSLVELYRQLGVLVRPGGVFLNGDSLGFAPHLPSFNTVTEHGQARWGAEARAAGKEDWEGWWDQLRREPGMEPLFAERGRRFSNKTRPPHTLVDVHLAALRNAGFHEVDVIWQHLDNRVVMAVR
jgi:SAM-dependent methyltransferase